MAYEKLLYGVEEQVCTITLNRGVGRPGFEGGDDAPGGAGWGEGEYDGGGDSGGVGGVGSESAGMVLVSEMPQCVVHLVGACSLDVTRQLGLKPSYQRAVFGDEY